MTRAAEYQAAVAASERVAWKIDDVFFDRAPDLRKALLPESLALVGDIQCLNAKEKQTLNQIRGNSYAYLFSFIEASIIRGVLDQLAAGRPGQDMRTRALLRFAEEEVKHQQLFWRYNDAFKKALGKTPKALALRVGAEDVAAVVAKNSPAAVFLTLLHVEWVSQRHHVEAVSNSTEDLDPLFKDMLRFHWMEETQHVRTDLALLDEFFDQLGPADVDAAVDAYLGLGKAIDGLLYQQVELDIETLSDVLGRTFTAEEKAELLSSQAYACRKGLLWMGMTHAPFVSFLEKLGGSAASKVAAMAQMMA